MSTEPLGSYSNIHLIINPVSGQGRAPLAEIRHRFQKALGKRLTMHQTDPGLGAKEIAEGALSSGADLVIAFGGDGTMLEVSEALMYKDVPLGVIPGGTANVFASELELPGEKMQAIDLLLTGKTIERTIDMGCVGDEHFLLRLGIGLEAAMTVMTERDDKDRYGFWAYLLTAMRVGRRMKQAHYHIVVDGKRKKVKGVTCVICNSGNLGLPGIKIMPDIEISDGYLDVIVVREATLWSAASVAYHAAKGVVSPEKPHPDRDCYSIYSLRGKKIKVISASGQVAARDGEKLRAGFPLKISVEHNALKVLVADDEA